MSAQLIRGAVAFVLGLTLTAFASQLYIAWERHHASVIYPLSQEQHDTAEGR
jgi:hypothetical protein